MKNTVITVFFFVIFTLLGVLIQPARQFFVKLIFVLGQVFTLNLFQNAITPVRIYTSNLIQKIAISNFILNFCTLTGHFPPIWAKFYCNFHQILPNFFAPTTLKRPVKVQKSHLNIKKTNLSAKIRKARLDVFLIFPKEKLQKRTVQRGHTPL